MVVSLDIKAVFDAVGREFLLECLLLKAVPRKYIKIVLSLNLNATGQVDCDQN